jgi:hypothetical protein
MHRWQIHEEHFILAAGRPQSQVKREGLASFSFRSSFWRA